MFTGIVQSVGAVDALDKRGHGARLTVRARAGDGALRRLKAGDSIAVNGCCLTIVTKRAGIFAADLTRETLDRSALGDLSRGDRVNLEAPLRAGDALSGHMLQGHVEATGTLIELVPASPPGQTRAGKDDASGWWLRLDVPAELTPYLVHKGTIAIEGISLTIAELTRTRSDARVGIAIIPYTYRHTHLAHLKPGARLNLETDPIARHLEQLLAAREAGRRHPPSLAELRKQGF